VASPRGRDTVGPKPKEKTTGPVARPRFPPLSVTRMRRELHLPASSLSPRRLLPCARLPSFQGALDRGARDVPPEDCAGARIGGAVIGPNPPFFPFPIPPSSPRTSRRLDREAELLRGRPWSTPVTLGRRPSSPTAEAVGALLAAVRPREPDMVGTCGSKSPAMPSPTVT